MLDLIGVLVAESKGVEETGNFFAKIFELVCEAGKKWDKCFELVWVVWKLGEKWVNECMGWMK